MKDQFSRNFLIALFGIILAIVAGFLIAKTAFLGLLIIPLAVIALIIIYLVVRSPELGWLLIVFFLPFERVPSYEVGGINIKINTFLGFLTLISWVLALMFKGNPSTPLSFESEPEGSSLRVEDRAEKYKVQPNFLSIPLFLFVMALFLSLAQAINFTRATSVLIFTIFTIALSILAVNMVYSKETLRKTILVLFLSSFFVSLFGIFQFGGDVVGLPQSLTLLKEGYTSVVFGFPRVQAFSMEPLYFANYLLIPISVGLALFINRAEPIKRWWMAGLIGLILLNFILTVSRGGYLGLIGSFLVLGILLFKRLFNWKTILIGIVTVIIVVYGVAFALSKGETRATIEFLGHIQLQDMKRGESVEGRLITFKQGMNAFYESPVFGIGLGNYGPWATFYPDARPKTGWPIVNNEFIELLAETGIVGTTIFSLIILCLCIRTFMALKYAHDVFLRSVLIGLFAAFVGVLIQYNFMSTLYIIHVWVLVGLLVAVQNIILKSKIQITNDK